MSIFVKKLLANQPFGDVTLYTEIKVRLRVRKQSNNRIQFVAIYPFEQDVCGRP